MRTGLVRFETTLIDKLLSERTEIMKRDNNALMPIGIEYNLGSSLDCVATSDTSMFFILVYGLIAYFQLMLADSFSYFMDQQSNISSIIVYHLYLDAHR